MIHDASKLKLNQNLDDFVFKFVFKFILLPFDLKKKFKHFKHHFSVT